MAVDTFSFLPESMKMRIPGNPWWRPALIVLALCTAAIPHCPKECVPTESFTPVREGVVDVKFCDSCFQFCDVRTFYRDTVMQALKTKYNQSRHVIFGYIDSLKRYQKADSVYFEGDLVGVDTSEWESLTVSVFGELKGSLGKTRFTMVDSMAYVPAIPWATSYRDYDGRPFLAFFNTLTGNKNQNDSMGVGPVDGCFFEPQAFIISDSSIHKMGYDNERIPGVSVRVADFFREVGHPGAPIPQKKTVSNRVMTPHNRQPSRVRTQGLRRYWYDLKGRRLEGGLPGKPGDAATLPAGPCSWRYFH